MQSTSNLIRSWRLNDYDSVRIILNKTNTWGDDLIKLLDFDQELFNKFRRNKVNGSYGRFLCECGNIYLNRVSEMNEITMINLFKIIIIHYSASDVRTEPFVTTLIQYNEHAFVDMFLY